MKQNPRLAKPISLALLCVIAGCSYNIQLTARDGGKVYSGKSHGGTGSGSIDITIDDRLYTGEMVRTAPSETFGLLQQYGAGPKPTSGVDEGFGGTVEIKAQPVSSDGRGLRCDFTVDVQGLGGGICVDDSKHVYDVVISMR